MPDESNQNVQTESDVVDKIQSELNYIKTATYGEQVRGSIHDGIKKIAQEVDKAVYEIRTSDPVALRRTIAPMYDTENTSTVYKVGAYVFRYDPLDQEHPEEPSLYMCQKDTTGGTFQGSCWVKKEIGTMLHTNSEFNQFRFDSDSSPGILAGKSCDDLTYPSVWYVNKVDGISTLIDFPIDGPGWIRISGPNSGRLMQEVYPSDIETYSYRLFRTKNLRTIEGVTATTWTDWYKVPLISKDDIDINDISDLLQSMFIRKNVVLDIGRYIGTVGSHIGANTSSGWNMCDIEAEHGKTYRITVRTIGSESNQPYIFLCDANDIILSIVTAQTTTIGHITKIISPADTVSKIYITGYNINSSDSDIIIKVEEPGVSSATVNGTSLVMN